MPSQSLLNEKQTHLYASNQLKSPRVHSVYPQIPARGKTTFTLRSCEAEHHGTLLYDTDTNENMTGLDLDFLNDIHIN